MTAQELREKYLNFFKSKGHTIIPSASLISEDQSVHFTTAGMQQFKPFYINPEKAPYSKATSVQKCLRTNDIEEVGDETHLTFFEMLGNFSFGYPEKNGSYFKEEAIQYAWEFLTEVLKVDKKRIYATYFKGEREIPEDKESLEILKKIESLKKIQPQGFKDNFWSLGTEGSPGGPTVEFYIDGIEIWNLVFNEYIFKNSKYEPSKYKGVDTGMGLERLLATLNGEKDVYKTDLFQKEIKKIEENTGVDYISETVPIRRIADHKRSINELIQEGIMPGKNGRESVLRTLMRVSFVEVKYLMEPRFVLEKNQKITPTEAFKRMFVDWSKIVLLILPNSEKARDVIIQEYKDYLALEKPGNQYFKRHQGKFIDGKTIFESRDTFGLSPEGIVELWKRTGHEVDVKWRESYDVAFEKHKEISRTSAGMFKGGLADAGEATAKLHTATHLLLAALREILGPETYQKGSNITAERLRFDFNYPQKLTEEQLKKIEDLVNEKIQENIPVEMTEMPKDEALKIAKVSFDPSKYGDVVKVYKIGNFSVEVCGGPHAKSTGELGKFKITKEEASSAGIRRIKAILE